MPYGISDSQSDCGGWATVKQNADGSYETIGCHESKQDAIDQMVAVSISEDIEPLGEVGRVADAVLETREIDMTPPEYMRASARRGLELHEQGYSGDGLMPATVTDARRMAAGEALSESKWRRIGPWIARHIIDLDAVQGDEITPGLVAMLLWGGGSNRTSARRTQAYAEDIVKRLDDEVRYSASQPRAPDGKWTSGGGGAMAGDSEGGGGDGGGGGGSSSDGNVGSTDADDSFDDDLELDFTPGSADQTMVMADVLSEEQGDYIENLKPHETLAIERYTQDTYYPINQALRGAPPPPPTGRDAERALERAATIDAVIRNSPPLEEDVEVFRGVAAGALGIASVDEVDSLVGGTFKDAGIVSTSLNAKVSEEFGGGRSGPTVRMEVLVPAGSKALYVEPLSAAMGEYEVLLPTGSTFKIGAVRRDPKTNTPILSVELVGS